MKQDIIFTGKSVELALEEAAGKLGVEKDKLVYEVLEQEKSGFLGLGSAPAKIKVERTVAGEVVAKEFVETLLRDMDIEAEVEVIPAKRSDRTINIKGDAAGVLIGHHGDTLDALQYLTNLAANKREEDESRDYVHIAVDVENYRSKREATLRSLARRMASKVQKSKKSVMLEPMSPYERRIIHSEVQGIEGVSTNSVGSENNRRVVIYLESEGFSLPNGAQVPHSEGKRSESRREKSRRSERKRSSYSSAQKKPKVAQPLYDDGEKLTTEELSDLISTYGSKEKPQREQPKKFKDFDEYLNSLLGGLSDSGNGSDSEEK
ncbi:MAG: protein jag [Clostridia bacterium]|nr:protein jag [Clostridia bacterium]